MMGESQEMLGDGVGQRRVTAVLGDVDVEVRTSADRAGRDLVDYLGEFYPLRLPTGTPPAWTVDARLGKAAPPLRPNPFGVGYLADEQRRCLTLRAPALFDLQVTTRKSVREVFLGDCERRRYVMLHASSIASPAGSGRRQVVLFVGDKRAGKTTLALRARVKHGWSLLSNDHLIIFAEPSPSPDSGAGGTRLVITSLPTLIPVKVGTLLDLGGMLPPPWDAQGVDLAEYRAMPVRQRYGLDAGVLYTYRRLGQDNPLLTPLGSDTAVTVVLPGYAPSDEPIGTPLAAPDPVAALRQHLRTDWPADPRLNQQHLPRSQRSAAEFTADGAALVTALTRQAPVLSWRHRGEIAPLLAYLDTPAITTEASRGTR